MVCQRQFQQSNFVSPVVARDLFYGNMLFHLLYPQASSPTSLRICSCPGIKTLLHLTSSHHHLLGCSQQIHSTPTPAPAVLPAPPVTTRPATRSQALRLCSPFLHGWCCIVWCLAMHAPLHCCGRGESMRAYERSVERKCSSRIFIVTKAWKSGVTFLHW